MPLSSLADTGANGYLFLDTQRALRICRAFQVPTIRLPTPGQARGFDNQVRIPITHAVRLDFEIDGHRFLCAPFLIVDLGHCDCILGKKWFASHDVWLDSRDQRLLWPEMRSPDRKIREMGNTTAIPSWRPVQTANTDQRGGYAKMSRALMGHEKSPVSMPPPKKRAPGALASLTLDIAAIGSAPFHRLTRKKKNEVFVASIQDIDRISEEKRVREREDEDALEEDLIREQLPACYKDFEDVFSKRASDRLPPLRDRNYQIELEEGARPEEVIGYSPLYKFSIPELEAARNYIVDNLSKEFISPSSAPYASPILMVKKPGGGLRLCVDYRKLNAITKKDRYPIPLIDELMAQLSQATIFTKLDIRQGFHRLRLDPGDTDLTTFRTRYGTYKYNVLPFGLTNGPAAFQRFVNENFIDYLDKFVTVYIDDLLIYSKNRVEHELHVKLVLARLRQAGLQASIRKCEFGVTRTKYLGFVITTDGIEVDPEKTAIIRDWQAPTSVKAVQSFLGFGNFYRRFIPHYSRVAKPLYHLTKADVPFRWTAHCQQSFDELKSRLTNAPVLRHYDPGSPTQLETDASDHVVAGVLSQQYENNWHPVAYFSKSMSPPERNYEIHDKELLAIVRSLEMWRAELEGLQCRDRFSIYTDHRALEYFMTSKKLNARQARWAEFLSRFNFIIRYRPGRNNTLADALSRPAHSGLSEDDYRMQTLLRPEKVENPPVVHLSPLDHSVPDQPAPAPIPDSVVDELRYANRTVASLAGWREIAARGDETWTLDDGLLLRSGKLVVPLDPDPTLRTRLLNEVHRQVSTAHPGQAKTRSLVGTRYYWPGWRNDVTRYVRNCVSCRQTSNPRDKKPGLLHPLPVPDRPWQHISMDFHMFPRDKHGYDNVLVIVDRLSKHAISIPCHTTITAEGTARLFIEHVYRHRGPPETVVSDRGPQFISAFWNEFCHVLGIKLKLSTAHHAETDGQSEIAIQYLTMRVRPYVSYHQDNWSELLPLIDFASACVTHETTQVAPFLVDCGYEPRTSFDWTRRPPSSSQDERMSRERARALGYHMHHIWSTVREQTTAAQSTHRRNANRHRRPVDFTVGDSVWLMLKPYKTDRPSKKLDHQMAGPFPIVEQVGNSFQLDLPDSMNIHPVFSPDKLRKAAADPLPGQHVEPPAPITIQDDHEWEVEKILTSRLSRGKVQYRVKWLGFDHDNTWYSASNFQGAPHLLRAYHATYPNRPGPPASLGRWLTAWENGEELSHDDDDRPEDSSSTAGGNVTAETPRTRLSPLRGSAMGP